MYKQKLVYQNRPDNEFKVTHQKKLPRLTLLDQAENDVCLHVERVKRLCKLLCLSLAKKTAFTKIITPEFIDTVCLASTFHDLGKVEIEYDILLKPGPLNKEEYEIMKTHTIIGAAKLTSIYRQHMNNEYVEKGIEIAQYHHEKWDGNGYPTGLSETAIPLSARIVALVDVYEALRAQRSYKEPYSHEKSMGIIMDKCGTHFDPQIVSEFVKIERDVDMTYSEMIK